MQRVCFWKTVSLFNHVLQPSQAFALFYQTLIFSLKNIALSKWISSNIDVPLGLQLLMVDINGNVTVDNDVLYKHLSNTKYDVEQQTDTTSMMKWISRLILRLATDYSISSKVDRSCEFESLNEFLKQFHSSLPTMTHSSQKQSLRSLSALSTDDRSTLSDDDDEDMHNDENDSSRRAIYRALMKCLEYTSATQASTPLYSHSNPTEMQDLENNSIALYNQQIIQILCSDTLELEMELARDSLQHQSSVELLPVTSTNDKALFNYYSIWSTLWRDVTVEYIQLNNNKSLRKVVSKEETDQVLDQITQQQGNSKRSRRRPLNIDEDDHLCLHDRLMFEIKQKRRLKPIEQPSITGSIRKRIRPLQQSIESDCSSDEDDAERRDEYGRKRVTVVDCLFRSSSSSEDPTETNGNNHVSQTVRNSISTEHISMEKLLQLMKDSSDVLSLTYDEFCHIRNVITRAELETLLFDEKLYTEVAQSKLCFTCRKVHFNLLKFTFGIQCNVCKQKVCRNCVTQIALPKDRLNDLPIQAFTPLTLAKSFYNSDRSHPLDTQSPLTPTMNDVLNDFNHDDGGSRRCSTPGHSRNQSDSNKWRTEPIDICTDCFFLLQQIRKKSRQRHISPAVTSHLVSSTSSTFNRSYHSSSRSTSNYNLSSSSSASSLVALLAQQQQQRSLMVKATSMHSNLKQTKSAQELSSHTDPLQALTVLAATSNTPERVSLSRHHLFLKLQPVYDVKLNNVKTE